MGFSFAHPVLPPFYLLPSGGACMRYVLPRGKSYFPENNWLHPALSCSCSVFNSPRMQTVLSSSSLHILKHYFRSISLEKPKLLDRMSTVCCPSWRWVMVLPWLHGAAMVAKQTKAQRKLKAVNLDCYLNCKGRCPGGECPAFQIPL